MTVPKLRQKANEATRTADAVVNSKANFRQQAEKRLEANNKHKELGKTFDKYNKDKDGCFTGKELKTYAKGEFDFTLPTAAVDRILSGQQKVKKDDLQRIKVAVAIEREKARNAKRCEEREEKEKEAAEARAKLLQDVKAAVKVVEDTEEQLKATEQSM